MHVLRIALALFCFGLAGPVTAQSLSEEECADIRTRFNIVAPGCIIGETQQVQPSPAPSQKETVAQVDRENNVFFPRGGSALDTDAKAQLDMLARVLNTSPMAQACLKLVGHSDASGSDKINIDLSLERAVAVANYLGTAIGTPTRIRDIDAVGEADLLLTARPSDPMNRRVEIFARTCRGV
ncbi:OmpA family protein [Actibacterium mucosum]|nr:OmpA family protein [Actibacterium mucosum]